MTTANPHSLNATHDPEARSWLESANLPACDFPIQNLPFCVFHRAGSTEASRGGLGIGDQIVDLAAVANGALLNGDAAIGARAGAAPTLNALMALGPTVWSALRHAVFAGLSRTSAAQKDLRKCLVPQREAVFSLPAQIGDYTDFFTSIYHATAMGRMLRPDNPLLPNYKWLPIGYHGRSSSIGVSGQSFPRPRGQRLTPGASQPSFGPSARLDYELELGLYAGPGNPRGAPIALSQAEDHIFGMCLLNDWSARDIQTWEYQPLGPFLAKNFATTVSPWVVSLEALAPFRLPFARPESDPEPLPYLDSPANRASGALDIRIEASLQSPAMRERNEVPHRLSSSSFRHSYWTIAQLITHHTSNGCDLRPGDLLGTGTQSGPTPGEAGSLVELSVGGKQRVRISHNEERTFLEDGDTVVFRAWCERPGAVSIGFGELVGHVLPAI
jgi:fumarylacetoacetase